MFALSLLSLSFVRTESALGVLFETDTSTGRLDHHPHTDSERQLSARRAGPTAGGTAV